MWSSSQSATLVVLSSLAMLANGALLQSCESAGNCVFEVRGVSDRVYLDCNEEQQLCSCSQFPYIADVPAWDLQLSPSGSCRIAETGPCGKDRNMVLECMEGAECVEGRCRRLEKVGTATEGELCTESIDCRQGLKCSVTGFYFQPTRRCTNLTFVDNYGPEVHQQETLETTTSKQPAEHHHHHHHHKHDHQAPNSNEHQQQQVPGGKVPPPPPQPNSMEQRQQEQDERRTSKGPSSEAPPSSPPVVAAPTAKATGGNGSGVGSSLRGSWMMALVSAVAVVVLGMSRSCC